MVERKKGKSKALDYGKILADNDPKLEKTSPKATPEEIALYLREKGWGRKKKKLEATDTAYNSWRQLRSVSGGAGSELDLLNESFTGALDVDSDLSDIQSPPRRDYKLPIFGTDFSKI